MWHRHFKYPFSYVALWALAWVLILDAWGAHRSDRFRSALQEAGVVLRAAALFALVALAFLTALKIYDVSRLFLLLAFLLQVVLALVLRVALRAAAGRLRARARGLCHVLIVGTGERGRALAREMARRPEMGLRVIGFLGDGATGGRGVHLLGGSSPNFGVKIPLGRFT